MKQIFVTIIMLLGVIGLGVLSWYALIFGWGNYPISTLIILILVIGWIIVQWAKSVIDY